MIADAANLLPVEDEERGWSLAMLNDTRGQAAVLRAVDALICPPSGPTGQIELIA